MINNKLQVALAALALGTQLASPATAGVRPADLRSLSTLAAAGQATEMQALLSTNPQLAQAIARVGEHEGVPLLVKGEGNGRSNGNNRNNGNHNGHDRGRGHDGDNGNHSGHGGHGGMY